MYQVWVTTLAEGTLEYALASEHDLLDEAKLALLDQVRLVRVLQAEILDPGIPDEKIWVVAGHEWDTGGRKPPNTSHAASLIRLAGALDPDIDS